MLARAGRDPGYETAHVCERWRQFENFLADMGRRPSPQYSLDREDTYGHYEPDNCRWATRSTQQKNKRSTRRWQRGDEVGTLVDWASRLGISKELAYWRMKTWGTFVKDEEWQLLRAE